MLILNNHAILHVQLGIKSTNKVWEFWQLLIKIFNEIQDDDQRIKICDFDW